VSQIIPYSEACERNKKVILTVIDPYLKRLKSVLEIGSGTAQHALYFSKENPHLQWQTSDQKAYLKGIESQLANSAVKNVLAPIEINVNQQEWVAGDASYCAVFTANTLHIMSDDDVAAFFTGLPKITKPNAYLIVYGPFKYNGKFTSDSNATFDQSLRSRGVGSSIKDFETLQRLASQVGFDLKVDNSMPANNQCLIFKRGQSA